MMGLTCRTCTTAPVPQSTSLPTVPIDCDHPALARAAGPHLRRAASGRQVQAVPAFSRIQQVVRNRSHLVRRVVDRASSFDSGLQANGNVRPARVFRFVVVNPTVRTSPAVPFREGTPAGHDQYRRPVRNPPGRPDQNSLRSVFCFFRTRSEATRLQIRSLLRAP